MSSRKFSVIVPAARLVKLPRCGECRKVVRGDLVSVTNGDIRMTYHQRCYARLWKARRSALVME